MMRTFNPTLTIGIKEDLNMVRKTKRKSIYEWRNFSNPKVFLIICRLKGTNNFIAYHIQAPTRTKAIFIVMRPPYNVHETDVMYCFSPSDVENGALSADTVFEYYYEKVAL